MLDWSYSDGGASKVRPAVVVQSDALNRRLTATVVAALTSNTARAHLPTQLFIERDTPAGRAAGVVRDSAVTAENLLTVDRSLILRRIGRLTPALRSELDDCLRSVLEL
ncbi:mRNA interferase MazF6 [Alienimonas californiensis]|uniref:mRNA interferase MazF6 n=1 Tax=Alienimonas californiensis TaxID=2527989 RepID=A0A517P704_9PLAN|nr:mRNA interferase MazF6 [Alienimonas californiensis]